MSTITSTVSTATETETVSTVTQVRPSLDAIIDASVSKVGVKGADPFPIVDKLWDLFAGKGIRTVFLSIGTSVSPLADLEISESLGCPLYICALNDSEQKNWSDVSTVLKERARPSSASSFTEFVDTKWILPKNLRRIDALPWWTDGTLDLSGVTLPTQKLDTLISSLSATMKLKDGAKRIDILKVDTTQSTPGLEIPILHNILSEGYRPSVVLVKWSAMPDVSIKITLAAGHLQCCGYSLFSVIDDKFLYYFNDDNLYEICSWEKRTAINPIAAEILKATSRRA
jgi:hypothetical protein